MLKISDAVAALRDAQAVVASEILDDETKNLILRAIARPLKMGAHTALPVEFAAIEAAIIGLIIIPIEVPADAGPEPAREPAQARTRKAAGRKSTPQVAARVR